MIHKKTVSINGTLREKTWEVDVHAISTLRNNEWIEEFPQLLQRDLVEMHQAFPHWFLAVGEGDSPAACSNDKDFIVPMDGGLKCVGCGKMYSRPASSLIWIGMLPVQITGANLVEGKIRKKISNMTMNMPYFDQGQAFFILPMIKVIYPSSWPRSAPAAYYPRGFFEVLGKRNPGTSHEHHMRDNLMMCLFSGWHQMSICEVIQNRIAPHALAQVKIANGERPQRWFN